MTLGIVNINSCVTSKLLISKKKLPCDNRISCRQILLYIVNKHPCNLFTMCSFFNKLFNVTVNNNTIYSKNRISNRNFHSKLTIILSQINSISLIEEFSETLINKHWRTHMHNHIGNEAKLSAVFQFAVRHLVYDVPIFVALLVLCVAYFLDLGVNLVTLFRRWKAKNHAVSEKSTNISVLQKKTFTSWY